MAQPLGQYKLEGTRNLDTHPCLTDPNTYPRFLEGYESFKNLMTAAINGTEPITIYKFGDGDGQFLRRQSAGSATVGFRALSKSFDEINHERFVIGARACDWYACDIYPEHVKAFRSLFAREADFPAEYIYASVASRWIFRHFSGGIGLIGAAEKIELIRHLLRDKAYCRYLGINHFQDLITIPQKFACDNLETTEEIIATQLAKSRSRLFLLGIGHVKSGLLHRLKHYTNSVFLDVGQGIDALAGIIDTEKPFFGDWMNFRVANQALYKEVDYLSYLPYDFIHPG